MPPSAHKGNDVSVSPGVKRWRGAYRQLKPSQFEVEAAYQRYLARKQARPTLGIGGLVWNFAGGLAAAALVLVVVNRFAAQSLEGAQSPEGQAAQLASTTSVAPNEAEAGEQLDPQQAVSGSKVHPSKSSTEVPTAAAKYAAYFERDGERISVQPGVEYEVAAGQSVTVVLGGQEQRIVGPKLIEFELAADQASGWRLLSHEPAPASQRLSEPAASPQARAPGVGADAVRSGVVGEGEPELWSEAASAMRQGQTARAEAALTRLSQRGSPATRDAAALALAQLWLARGDARARPVLRRLQDTGATPLIRGRARALLK